MEVFDSNVWIYALTRECEEATTLVENTLGIGDSGGNDGVTDGPTVVGVNAYIFDEVIRNLGRSTQPRETINVIQTRFADIVYGNKYVQGPSQEAISRMNIDVVRNDPTVQTLATGFGIQAKDVPVVVYAHQCVDNYGDPVTIHTADRQFSQFRSRRYFDDIGIEYVDCSAGELS